MVNKRKGFSLIELLIASSILMAVLLVGYSSYSLYMSSWEKRVDYFWKESSKSLSQTVMYRSLKGAVDYVVEIEKGVPATYFYATDNSIRYITNSAIFSDTLSIAEIEFISNEDRTTVLYKEVALEGWSLFSVQNTFEWQHSIKISEFEGVVSLRLFGWDSWLQQVQASNNLAENILPSWYSNHDMVRRQIFPLKLAIFVENELTFLIDWNFRSHDKLYLYQQASA